MSGHEYSTDAAGSRPVTLRYRYAGTMTVADFLEFTAERARWLDVSGWVAASGDNAVTMVAAGPEAMVGALEMACTLGPLNAVITDIEVHDEDGPVAAGFAIRR